MWQFWSQWKSSNYYCYQSRRKQLMTGLESVKESVTKLSSLFPTVFLAGVFPIIPKVNTSKCVTIESFTTSLIKLPWTQTEVTDSRWLIELRPGEMNRISVSSVHCGALMDSWHSFYICPHSFSLSVSYSSMKVKKNSTSQRGEWKCSVWVEETLHVGCLLRRKAARIWRSLWLVNTRGIFRPITSTFPATSTALPTF